MLQAVHLGSQEKFDISAVCLESVRGIYESLVNVIVLSPITRVQLPFVRTTGTMWGERRA